MNLVPARRVLQQVDDADRVGGFPFVRERDVGHQALYRGIQVEPAFLARLQHRQRREGLRN